MSRHFSWCPHVLHFHADSEFNYELWDKGSGNVISVHPTITELVQNAFALGQRNPQMDWKDITATTPFDEGHET